MTGIPNSLDSTTPKVSSSRVGFLSRIPDWLFAPVDIASMVFFRIAFGLIMLWEVFRYFDYGWIGRYWIEPEFFFTFPGFHWVKPWPGDGMYYHFAIMGILAVFIAIGFYYRISAALFWLAFTYVFLLDQAPYLNHFYLISLMSFLLIFVPANCAVSVDAYFDEQIQSDKVPRWTLFLLQFQMGVVYFFGGVAKINGDWLRTEPMRAWLANRVNAFPVLGPLFVEEPVVLFFTYGGLFFDLFIVPFVLWKKTRPFAFASVLFFHIMNARMFSIGIFPWFAIAATTLFFDPDWPRNVLNFPVYGRSEPEATSLIPSRIYYAGATVFVGFWVATQVLLPLRHWLYPGNVSWNEQGHRFSWHMKLRDKNATAQFFVTDLDSGQTWSVEPEDYLSSRQARKMETRPNMIVQFAHYLDDRMADAGYANVSVTAVVYASLNGREYQLLIDPESDLSEVPMAVIEQPATWVVELEQPLPRRLPVAAFIGGDVDE